MEIPSPIPNLVVKHFIADNTAGSPGGNVGRCQLIEFLLNPQELILSYYTLKVGQGKLFYFTSCLYKLFYLYILYLIFGFDIYFLVKVIFYIKLIENNHIISFFIFNKLYYNKS